MKEKNIKIIKPWNGDFMYKKTVMKRQCAFIPLPYKHRRDPNCF